MKIAYLLSLVILALLLATVSCGVLSTLQVVVDAAAAAVPILEAAGVPIPPALPAYVAAVSDCIGNADTTNPTTGQIATIAACLANQVEPALPPGLPQAVANIIGQIAKDVANFLAQNNVKGIRAGTTANVPLNAREARTFHDLTAKARETSRKARALIK
jgi:hypothetical protein